ncbi:MAG: hypothetical protein E6649_05385 [Paeniclostridium sordellii]|nr:hypothetical protein [Paeniclostridium sordellii]
MSAAATEKTLKATIQLVDRYSKPIENVTKKTKVFSKVASKVKKVVLKVDDKASRGINKVLGGLKKIKSFKVLKPVVKFKDAASRSINKILGGLKKLKGLKTVQLVIKAKDNAMKTINKVTGKVKAVTRKVHSIAVSAKDKASKVLGGIKSKLGLLAKGLVIPIIASVSTIKSAMDLETQKVSMKHFMGVGNKGKSKAQIAKMSESYVKGLRDNANKTPFETGEVMAIGARALQIAEGNVKQSMKYVKLAEDMAAMNPGKTVSDAMEAIADMNMGEYARLTEFGVKATKENGDNPKSVEKKLQDMYKGGAEKLSGTAKGKFSTALGTLKSAIADFGTSFLPMVSGVFDKITAGLNGVTPKLMEFSNMLSERISKIDFASLFQSFDLSSVTSAFQPLVDMFDRFFSAIESKSPVAMGIMQVLGSVFNFVFNAIGMVIRAVSPVIESIFKFIGEHGAEISNIINGLGVIWQAVWSVAGALLSGAWAVAKPLLSALLKALSKVSDMVQSVGKWWQDMANKINKNPIVATVKKVFSGGDEGGSKSKKKGKRSAFGTREVRGNDIPFRLHDGERVLTKGEAKRLDNQKQIGNGVVVQINGLTVREEADIDRIATKLVKKLNQNKIILGGTV